MASTAADTDSWALTDSALDFLQRAVTEVTTGSSEYKYAALDLAVAVETLIKARLVREHWTLVVKPIDKKTTKAAFLAGTGRTIGPEEGIERLEKVVGLAIPLRQAAQVAALTGLRNQVVHFAPPTGPGADPAMLDKIGDGLSFALWFLDHHFGSDAPVAEAERIVEVKSSISTELAQIGGLAKKRLADISTKLDAEPRLYWCPNCTQNTLALRAGAEPECLYCYATGVGEAVAEAYVAYSLISHSSVETCTNCGTLALVGGVRPVKDSTAAPEPAPYWLCFSCSMTAGQADFINCLICGEMTTEVALGMCEMCSSERFEKF